MASGGGKAALVQKVRAAMKQLEKIAGELDKIDFGANVSNTVTGAIGTLYGALAVTGAIAGFLTLGSAFLVTIAALTTASVSIGTTIAEYFLSKAQLDAANKAWEELLKDPDFAQYVYDASSCEVSKENGISVTTAGDLHSVVGSSKSVYDVIKKARSNRQTLRQGRRIVIRVIRKLDRVAEGVFLPFTIYDLVSTSITLAKNEKSHGGDEVRKLINILHLVLKNLEK